LALFLSQDTQQYNVCIYSNASLTISLPIVKKNFLLLFCVLTCFSYNSFGQACTGSLGDPVVKQNFPTAGALPTGSTTYTHVANQCPSDGSYSVRASTTGCFSNSWHTISDHTTGGGTNVMVINASYTAGEFYSQTVSGLCPGVGYEFSSYIVNLLRSTACTSNPNRFPNITFRMETTAGVLIKTFNTGNVPTIAGTATITAAQWSRYATFFTSTTSTVVLKLINNAPGGCGNDLALDDIEFRPCGPTLSASIAGSTTKCIGTSSTLSSTISSGYTTPQYQWQVSTDNVTFTDIAGATASTYSPTYSAAGTFYYRLLAAENGNIGNSKCRITSNTATVTVNAIPVAPTVSVGLSYCQNQTATALTATGSNLLWYTAATGGIGSSTAPTPSTTTVGTTNYYASQTVSGCESARAILPVVVNPLPTITVVAGNASCPAPNSSGSIIATASGGTPSYTFSKDGSTFVSGNVFTSIAAGTYTITIKDSKGCTFSAAPVLVPQSNPLALATEVTNNCNVGSNGVITVSGTGGTGTIQYKIDAGAYGATTVFTNQTAGSHTVSIIDANMCEVSTTVIVPTITSPTVSVASQSSCVASNEGAIIVTPTGGTPAYQYQLNGGTAQSSPDFTGLVAGSYTIMITDSRNCTSTVMAIINQTPTAPTVTSPVNYCFGAMATALSATGSGTQNWYTVETGGSGSGTAPIPSTSVAGITNYYVSRTQNSCESTRSLIIVNVSPSISLSLAKVDACNGLTNGTITATVTGGVSPFQFNAGSGSQESNVFSNLAAATYSVTVTDAAGCTASQSIAVGTGPVLSVSGIIGGDCVDVGAGVVTAAGSGGTGSYEYKINGGDFQSSSSFTGLNGGLHTLIVKDGNGCLATNTVTIKAKPLVVASTDAPTCTGSLLKLYGLDGGSTATYSWTGPDGFTSTDRDPIIVFSSTAKNGTYTLTVTDNGCVASNMVAATCDAATPFPARLLSFDAQQIDNYNLVSWRASDFVDFEKFELEKSSDARHFEKIQTESVEKNKVETQFYSFTDDDPFEGANYYRLKMIDLDRSFQYSRMIAVWFEKNGEYAIAENPVQNQTINLKTNILDPKITLFDIRGAAVGFMSKATGNLYQLSINSAISSIYILRIAGVKKQFAIRILME
jgi:large repetitive protein